MIKSTLEKLNQAVATDSREALRALSLEFDFDEASRYRALRQGGWHTPLIALGISKSNLYSWRLTPLQEPSSWPMMLHSDSNVIQTVAVNQGTLLYLRFLSLISDVDVFLEMKDMMKPLTTWAAKIHPILGGAEHMEYFKKFCLNDDNFPSGAFNDPNHYPAMWGHYGGEAFANLKTLIDHLIRERNALPARATEDQFGPFTVRATHLLGFRAWALHDPTDIGVHESYMWDSFSEHHAYDAPGRKVYLIPSETERPAHSMQRIVGSLTDNLEALSSTVTASPLYPALKAMRGVPKSYYGKEHVEAAAAFDVNFDDPVMAWKCLVNAAYWSGIHSDETLLVAWEAAIYLSEKHGWTDIHEALVWQWEWYHDYKKKNGIQ